VFSAEHARYVLAAAAISSAIFSVVFKFRIVISW
jgi:hypothetical protein